MSLQYLRGNEKKNVAHLFVFKCLFSSKHTMCCKTITLIINDRLQDDPILNDDKHIEGIVNSLLQEMTVSSK